MTKKINIILSLAVLFAVSFICVGYAVLTDNLSVSGTAEVMPVFDTVVITNVTVASSTVNAENHQTVVPTNLKASLNGEAHEQVVYRITAHNYSETETFIYTGVVCSDVYADVSGKVAISAALDENGEESLLNNPEAASLSGTPVAPGEDVVFYAIYTLQEGLSGEEILINFSFKPVIYTVTYLNGNEVWAVDHIVNNTVAYHVREEGPEKAGQVFSDWVNANAVGVDSYPAGNTNSYTLSARWANIYLIIFVDEKGNVLYEEYFNDRSTGLSAEGQRIVDAKLAELAQIAAADEMRVAWSDYDIASATSDIIVRPVYTYTGNLRFTPVDTDGDGIIEYYQVDAVAKLNDPTKIPGRFQGLDVRVVNKLYLNDNNFDYGAGVTTIEIGEGVTTLNRNAIAYTEDLRTVKLPSSIAYIDKNAFSRNFSSDKKVLTIEFNGTMAQWQVIMNNSHDEWHNGLKTGSKVLCSDGYYELDRGFLELGGYNWKAKSY